MRIRYLYRISKGLNSLLYINRSFRHFRKYSVTLPFPKVLQIQTQSFCNGECTICPYPDLRGKQEQGVMTQELFEKIAHQAAQEPLLSYLTFALQNEPLLDGRVFKWVKYLKDLDRKKTISIISNGELISEFSVQEIIQSRLDVLVISLNAYTEATFNIINKGIDYKKVIKNINVLLSHPVLKPKIVLRFALTKINEKEICEAVRFWKKKGVRTDVAYISNRAGTLGNYSCYKTTRAPGMILKKMESRLWRYYENNILKCCFRPFFYMCVLFNGDVIVCCNDWNKTLVIGNAGQATLRSIWNADEMNRIRGLISERKFADIISCGQCEKSYR